MSCTNPLRIYSRTTFLNKISGAYMQEIPCGHCECCNDFKRIEWVLRAYYEWQDCIKKGGFGLFDTLTLNPESLDSRTKFGIPCFSKTDIRLFLKKFRKRMYEGGYDFRYLLTCEYGEKKHRPHYHILLFIFPPDNFSFRYHALKVNDFITDSWTEPIRKEDGSIISYRDADGLVKYEMRSLGFHDTPNMCISHIIDQVAGIRYVTKYITKDDEYYSQLLNMKKILLRGLTCCSVIKDINEWFDAAKPFHLQSLGFGSCAIKDLELIKDELANDPRVKVIAIDSKKPIPLPLYYMRKLFYDLHKTPYKSQNTGKPLYQWRLTKFGKLFKSIQIEKRINRYANQYADLAENALTYSVEGKDIFDNIKNLLGSRSWTDYSIYRNVYKGHFNDGKSYVDEPKEWLKFYLSSLNDGDEENYSYIDDSYHRNKYRQSLKREIINDTFHPDWEHFDEITNQLNILQTKKNLYLELEAIKVKEIRSNLSILKPD